MRPPASRPGAVNCATVGPAAFKPPGTEWGLNTTPSNVPYNGSITGDAFTYTGPSWAPFKRVVASVGPGTYKLTITGNDVYLKQDSNIVAAITIPTLKTYTVDVDAYKYYQILRAPELKTAAETVPLRLSQFDLPGGCEYRSVWDRIPSEMLTLTFTFTSLDPDTAVQLKGARMHGSGAFIVAFWPDGKGIALSSTKDIPGEFDIAYRRLYFAAQQDQWPKDEGGGLAYRLAPVKPGTLTEWSNEPPGECWPRRADPERGPVGVPSLSGRLSKPINSGAELGADLPPAAGPSEPSGPTGTPPGTRVTTGTGQQIYTQPLATLPALAFACSSPVAKDTFWTVRVPSYGATLKRVLAGISPGTYDVVATDSAVTPNVSTFNVVAYEVPENDFRYWGVTGPSGCFSQFDVPTLTTLAPLVDVEFKFKVLDPDGATTANPAFLGAFSSTGHLVAASSTPANWYALGAAHALVDASGDTATAKLAALNNASKLLGAVGKTLVGNDPTTPVQVLVDPARGNLSYGRASLAGLRTKTPGSGVGVGGPPSHSDPPTSGGSGGSGGSGSGSSGPQTAGPTVTDFEPDKVPVTTFKAPLPAAKNAKLEFAATVTLPVAPTASTFFIVGASAGTYKAEIESDLVDPKFTQTIEKLVTYEFIPTRWAYWGFRNFTGPIAGFSVFSLVLPLDATAAKLTKNTTANLTVKLTVLDGDGALSDPDKTLVAFGAKAPLFASGAFVANAPLVAAGYYKDKADTAKPLDERVALLSADAPALRAAFAQLKNAPDAKADPQRGSASLPSGLTGLATKKLDDGSKPGAVSSTCISDLMHKYKFKGLGTVDITVLVLAPLALAFMFGAVKGAKGGVLGLLLGFLGAYGYIAISEYVEASARCAPK
jgi:hypothetical protein